MPGTRGLLLGLAGACLVAGIGGGLVRLGIPLGLPAAPALAHGSLMLGFLGCVIGLERAIAFGGVTALGVPLASALAALLGLAGVRIAGNALLLVSPLLLVVLSAAIVRRQPAPHTVLLVIAAVAWAIGNGLYVAGASATLAAAWWFAFLVLTVAAERLEMTRLMPRRRRAAPLFVAASALLLCGAAVMILDAKLGSVVYGAGVAAIGLWLMSFDLARRTLRTEGFARYSACALLAGYGWLVAGGLAWIALPQGGPALRDLALHALALGFVVSMIFAHAPLMVPVILRLRMRYTPWLYVPLALLHGSLVLRLCAGVHDATLRQWGGALNAAAIALFAVSVVYGVRQKGPAPGNPGTNSTR